LVDKLPKELLEACAATLFLYARDIPSDSGLYARLEKAARDLNMNLLHLANESRRNFIFKNASRIPFRSPFFKELTADCPS
jgi:hypothetical protein